MFHRRSQADHFDVAHLLPNLRGRSARAGLFTLAFQFLKGALQFVSTVILARLLTPADFGLIAMATAITGALGMLKDGGLSAATLQHPNITHAQATNLFWLNVVLSTLLMVITALLAPAIVWFYSEPRLSTIVYVQAMLFLVSGISIQHHALLQRQMRFYAINTVGLISIITGIGVAVWGAYNGLGYHALLVSSLVSTFAFTGLLWLLSGWRPSLPGFQTNVMPMVRFGGNLTGFNFVNYFARNADNALIGWWWGETVLGIYSKAYGLLMMPLNQINSPVSSVVVPALSRLQTQPDEYRRFYRTAVLCIVSIGMPIIAFLAIQAHTVITVVLGDQWVSAVPVFQALAPAAFLGTFNVSTGWVYLSLGHVHRQLKWGFVSSALTVIAFFVAVPWGVSAVAAAFSISRIILKPIGVAICFRGTPLTPRDLVHAIWAPALASFVAALITVSANSALAVHAPSIIALVTALAIFGAAYMIAMFVLPPGRMFLKVARESAHLFLRVGKHPKHIYKDS